MLQVLSGAMEKLKVTDSCVCSVIPLKEGWEKDGVRLDKKGNQWYLCDFQKSYRLSCKGIRIHETTFSLYPNPDCWFLYPIKSSMTVGRDLSCTLSVLDSTISKQHFQILDGVLEDRESTNGTYRNGKRIQKCHLEPLDHLHFGQQEAYVLPGFLIVSFPIVDSVSVLVSEKKFFDVSRPALSADVPLPAMLSVSLESPRELPQLRKGKWFQAIGSSLLILVSGLLSALVVWIRAPEQMQSIITLLINSVSMCVAFGLYGFWNRKSSYTEQKKENEKLAQKYRTYCQIQYQKILEAQKEVQDTISKVVNQYQLCLNNFQREANRPFRLWIGWERKSWLQILYKQPDYLQVHDPLFQKQQELLLHIDTQMRQPLFLQEGESIQLPECSEDWIESLFLEWLLVAYTPERKWVWVDSHMQPAHRFLNHPACNQGQTRLCIRNEDEWMDFLSQMKKNCHYTFLIREDFVGPFHCKGATILRIQDSPGHFEPAVFVAKEDLFRKLLLLQQNHFLQGLDFMQIYGQSLDFFSCKTIRGSSVNLRICPGYTQNGHQIVIDLHESAQGPHGFLAGMTGSGKSEMLRSILIQLVLQNSPEQFQYLVIDFKGGALGQMFTRFAHCKGMVTNLEKGEMDRFEQSLQTFIENRQKLLQEFVKANPEQVAQIDAYNATHPKVPMAHVLILVDELAELKQSFPDFMFKLREIARIGRSLGIHCLLSTQKPMGVMDDQIWANMNFRICMQTATPSDSYEVLRHEKAFSLRKAGEFILQTQSEVQEVNGQGWYLQQEVFRYPCGYREVDEKGETLFSYHQETESLSAILANFIEMQTLNTQWIIPPFNQEALQENQMALIDVPWKQLVQEWKPKLGKWTWILCASFEKQKDWIQALAGWIKRPVYGLEIFDDVLDACMKETEFLQLESIQDSCFWIVNWNALRQKNLEILKSSSVGVFLFINQWQRTLHEQILPGQERICYAFDALDDVREFFGCPISQNFHCSSGKGWILQEHRLYAMLLRQRSFARRRESYPLAYRIRQNKALFYLGMDAMTQKEVYWAKKHPLLLCYAQQSMESRIFSLLEKWQTLDALQIESDLDKEADVYVLPIVYEMTQLQKESFLSRVYDLDICWMGQGLKDYGYLLKRRIPSFPDSGGVLWTEDEVIYFI